MARYDRRTIRHERNGADRHDQCRQVCCSNRFRHSYFHYDREILQYASTIDEAFAIAQKRKTFVSESILIGSSKDGKAAIIEKSPEKTVLFKGKEADRLICTNHYQSEEFSKDERNMENIRTSDSPYRFARLKELINENLPIDASKAASILRNHKGLQDADLGLANEMAINQFIAHHSVIFQPERAI